MERAPANLAEALFHSLYFDGKSPRSVGILVLVTYLYFATCRNGCADNTGRVS
jgi:hypothetical protein